MIDQEVVDEAVRRLVAAAAPDKVVLFGSHARGTANEHREQVDEWGDVVGTVLYEALTEGRVMYDAA